jgi:hypothetical protein
MVGRLLQPSLSSTQDHQTAGSGTSAFFLQPFSQSRIMVSFGSDSLPGIKGCIIVGGSCHRQIALSHVNTNNVTVALWGWVCDLKLQRDQQIKLLVGLVIPELGCSNAGFLLDEGDMLLISSIGNHHPPLQGEDADLLAWLKAVIAMVIVGERGGDVLGWLIESLVAFLGHACRAQDSVFLRLGPESFIGSADLTWHIASHLGRQAELQTDLLVAITLQGSLIAHLAMFKAVSTHVIQGITIGQLRFAQGCELGRLGMQFELGDDELFHDRSIVHVHTNINCTSV